jgi:hypothetical protein
VVGLGVEDAVHALEVGDRVADADARLGVDELEPAHGEDRVALDVGSAAHLAALRRRRVRREAHEHARHRVRARGRRPAGLGRAHGGGRASASAHDATIAVRRRTIGPVVAP